MSHFRKELQKRQPRDKKNRVWIFIPYDQLSDALGPLGREDPKRLGIVLVENPWKGERRPYHKQKLALILANMRHFALEQAARGVAVRHVVADGPYHRALELLIPELGPLRVMVPAERELHVDLQTLAEKGALELIPHEGWLTTESQFRAGSRKAPPWRMDNFYRFVRRDRGILMEGGKPAGGKYSFDAENRLPWRGLPHAPVPPTFPRDPIKEEVGRLIRDHFSHHPGRLDLDGLPGTKDDAKTLWSWAKDECLAFFGPYEDAMSLKSRNLFHTRISSLLNIHRITPGEVLSDTIDLDIPLASKEGFIRQVLGWREFMYHVHRTTNGFRNLPTGRSPVDRFPGDGGYSRWSGRSWKTPEGGDRLDGGALSSALGGETPLFPAYWGEESGLCCLDRVVSDVWDEGYSHHITRLMILCNIATLLDISPRELTDWFWVAYTDAFDWVVEPNVLGMGTYAMGDLITTKPYVSGAAYIHRMSDYCGICAFNPRTDCPISPLYWAFLSRHRSSLEDNHRLRMPMASLRRRDPARLKKDAAIFQKVQDILTGGGRITPEDLAEQK